MLSCRRVLADQAEHRGDAGDRLNERAGVFRKICHQVEQRRVCLEQGGLLITTRQGRIYIGIVEDLIGGLHQGQDCVTGELRVKTHTARSTLFPAAPQRHCQHPLQTRGQSHAANHATPSLHERISRCTPMPAHFDRDAVLRVSCTRPREPGSAGIRTPRAEAPTSSHTGQVGGCRFMTSPTQ